MKHRIFTIIVMLTSLIFIGCNGFEYSTATLRNGIFTYIINGNGMDYETYTFDETGRAGTFESGKYDYRFTNADDYNAGTYSTKEWVMIDGKQGSFSYDPETNILLITYTGGWTNKKDTASFGTGYFAPADYSWITYTDYYLGHGATDNKNSVTHTIEMNFVPNSDSSLLEVYAFDSNSSEGNYLYTYKETDNLSYTNNGVANSIVSVVSNSYSISETNLIITNSTEITETEGSNTPEVSHETEITEYAIKKFFLKGKETGDMSFQRVWREDNTVNFLCEQTKQSVIDYTGNTAPEEPSVSETTGIGYNSNANGDHTVSLEGGTTSTFVLKNMDTYIYLDTNEDFRIIAPEL